MKSEMQLREEEERQKGQDRQQKEMERNRKRERMCAWRMDDTTKRATQRETGRGGRRVWEKSMRKVGGKRVACERKSERGTKNEAWLHGWVSLTVGHTRESVLQTLLVITPSRQLSVLCSNASGLVASRASQQNRSNASLWNSDGSRKRSFVYLDRTTCDLTARDHLEERLARIVRWSTPTKV